MLSVDYKMMEIFSGEMSWGFKGFSWDTPMSTFVMVKNKIG